MSIKVCVEMYHINPLAQEARPLHHCPRISLQIWYLNQPRRHAVTGSIR